MNLEQLGLIGVFLAGAIPWFEAIAVIPAGIIFGLDPMWVVVSGVTGNAITIFLFAYFSSSLRNWFIERRRRSGKSGENPKFAKAQRAFEKYGVYGLAVIGPLVIGTQFAAAISVAAGVKPLKASLVITFATLFWATLIAVAMTLLGLQLDLPGTP
jgi:hypothetical protein